MRRDEIGPFRELTACLTFRRIARKVWFSSKPVFGREEPDRTKRMIVRFMILLLCAEAAPGLFTAAAQAEGGITT